MLLRAPIIAALLTASMVPPGMAAEPLTDAAMSGMHLYGGEVLNVQGSPAAGGQPGARVLEVSTDMLEMALDLLADEPESLDVGRDPRGPTPADSLARSTNPVFQVIEQITPVGGVGVLNIDPSRSSIATSISPSGSLGVETRTFVRDLQLDNLPDVSNTVRGSYRIQNLSTTSQTIFRATE